MFIIFSIVMIHKLKPGYVTHMFKARFTIMRKIQINLSKKLEYYKNVENVIQIDMKINL